MANSVDLKKKLQVSLKVGVGDSVRFLKKQTGLPDRLVERIAPYA